MGITMKWDDSGRAPEKTVIVWMFDGEWNWLEYGKLVDEAYQMQLERTPHIVDTIVDMSHGGRIPYGGAISNFVRGINKIPPNRGTVAIIGASGLLKALEPVIRRLTPKSSAYVFAESPDVAYRLFEARRRDREAG